MSTTNYAVMQAMAYSPTPLTDNLAASSTTTQAGGTRMIGEMNRFVTTAPVAATANSSAVLPSVTSQEASPLLLCVNDTTVAMNLFPSPGETINGLAANTAISVASGATAWCVKSGSPFGIGGVGTASNLNWRVSVMT